MANCHIVTFITGKLFEKHVPLPIQREIKSLQDMENAMHIYWNHMQADETEAVGFEHLRRYLADMRCHTLDKIDNVWIKPDELKSIIGSERNELLNIKGFMSEKKNHEVSEPGKCYRHVDDVHDFAFCRWT